MRAAALGVLLLAGGGITPPAQAQEEGDARAGRRLAGARCAVCHGNDGLARQPDAANLAGQTVVYLTNQLRAFRAGERRSEQMNLIARELTDAQIADLAAWFAAIAIEVTLPSR